MSLKIKMIAHCATTIMHHGKSLDCDTANLKGLRRLNLMEQSRINLFCGIALSQAL